RLERLRRGAEDEVGMAADHLRPDDDVYRFAGAVGFLGHELEAARVHRLRAGVVYLEPLLARVVADGVGHDLRDDEVAGEEIAGAVAPRLRRLLAPARDDERRGGPRKTLHFVSSSSCSAAVDATADAEIWPAARITISSVVCFCLSSYRRTSPRT